MAMQQLKLYKFLSLLSFKLGSIILNGTLVYKRIVVVLQVERYALLHYHEFTVTWGLLRNISSGFFKACNLAMAIVLERAVTTTAKIEVALFLWNYF